MAKIFKNIMLMLGLFTVILMMIGILFYEYIPNGIEVKEPIEYVADEKVTKTLATIKDEEKELFGTTSGSNKEEKIIHAYSLDAGDLAVYEQADSYISGKSDPFSAITTQSTVGGENNTNTNNSSNGNTSNTVNNNTNNKNNNTNNLTEVKDNTLLNSGTSK